MAVKDSEESSVTPQGGLDLHVNIKQYVRISTYLYTVMDDHEVAKTTNHHQDYVQWGGATPPLIFGL